LKSKEDLQVVKKGMVIYMKLIHHYILNKASGIKHRRNNLFRLIHYILNIIIVCLISFSGCTILNSDKTVDTKNPSYISKSGFLLNTQITIQIYDKQEEELLSDCFDLIAKYEAIYSRTDEESELYALNHGTAPHNGLTYQISKEMADLITYGLYYSTLSKGAFDITIAPITSLWNFTQFTPVIPSEDEIREALTHVNYKNLQVNGNQLTYASEGIQMDFGAIAKGYIADQVKKYLIKQGVKSALINLGGNLVCVGSKPDKSPFKVGIQKPFSDRNETIATIDIIDLSVVSSGIYERFFTLDDIIYHHILNPDNGFPYENELVSITIISKTSVEGDGLSTSCFALGLKKGMELINGLKDTYAVFITKDYQVHYSKNFLEVFSVTE
jgi:thiamine biosynthesis lipoprotein